MAIKDIKNGAWADISTLKIPVSGAYQEADHANALVNGAWAEVWTGIDPNAPQCAQWGLTKNNTDTKWSYSISNGRRTLSYSITNPVATASSSAVSFRITKPGGFGTTIKVRYTLTQTLTDMNGGTYIRDSRTNQLSSAITFNNYYNCTNQTFEGTAYASSAQSRLYLWVDAYSSFDIQGTITDLYINDELVIFV